MGLNFNPSVQKGIVPTAPTQLSSPTPTTPVAASLSATAGTGGTTGALGIGGTAGTGATAGTIGGTAGTTSTAGTLGLGGTAGKTAATADATMIALMCNVVKALSQMVSLVTGKPVAGPTAAPTPFSGALPGATAGTPAAAGTPAPSSAAGPAINFFTADDYRNFLLAGSRGGTTGTDERIESKFADPNSRFAKSDQAQFNAAVAAMYANQFKANALGLDAAFAPGKSIDQISGNLLKAQSVPMTPEAELLAKVAATYRGTGSVYNNPALKQLLVKWGRSDIASQPNVGDQNGDVQTVGGIVKALNEEVDPARRKAWLQDIFDFAGNTPSSPSGAVPDIANYQSAINQVRGGQLEQLLSAYAAR